MTHAVQDNTPSGELQATFLELQHRLRAYLRRRLPATAPVDDLVQDIFVKALQARHSGQHIDNLAGWLFTVARHTLADQYRQQTVNNVSGSAAEGEDLDALPAPDEDETQLHQAIAQCLTPFIDELPPLYRDTLLATELHGHTQRAYAEQHGVSVSAVKSRVARGRALLKQKLLACCQIEMRDGLVHDAQANTPGCCDNSQGDNGGDRCG